MAGDAIAAFVRLERWRTLARFELFGQMFA
jgi:hypothetical protein